MTARHFCGSFALATLTLCIACNSPDRQVGGAGGSDAGGGSKGGSDAGDGPQDASESGGGTGPSDTCVGVVCDSPPAPSCSSPEEYRSFDTLGSCTDGACSYTEHRIACPCQAGACTTDPCLAVTCDAPPANKCKDATTTTTYAATGACHDGACDYAVTDAPCPTNQACSGQGVCTPCNTDASCGSTCAACDGATPKCQSEGTSSACVGCLSNADCSDATPVCNPASKTCQAHPSCIGLAKTCGPSSNQDCCASGVVTGGTFNRSNDPAYPATVATFRLDNYEVTVGRFRRFVAAYSADMIAAGAGKNPNNPSDPGWDTAWNAALPADAVALKASVGRGACMNAAAPTWTDTAQTAASESMPINCIPWFQAEAFCIWDGGRLPTEAEWNYAAAGGAAQRNYPWGSAAPDCNNANFGSCGNGSRLNRVGSLSPQGDGVWGQSDLAGNLYEWVHDWYAEPYPATCNNCANLAPSMYREVRGYFSATESLSAFRNNYTPNNQPFDDVGIRCARAP